jgi:hypothetical protein
MPNATVRANARSMLESASNQKDAVADWRGAYMKLDESVHDVHIWASTTSVLAENLTAGGHSRLPTEHRAAAPGYRTPWRGRRPTGEELSRRLGIQTRE